VDEFLNTTINGLSSGSIYALGAIGLSLVYGILKLVNFAHGDFMTLGGYVAFAVNVSAGMPLAVAILAALAAVAGLGLVLEFTVWAPMRRRGAGILQLLLLSIGLAFVIRNMILFEWGGDDRKLDVDQFQSWNLFGDVNITAIQVTVIAIAGVVLVGVATMLRTTLIGKTIWPRSRGSTPGGWWSTPGCWRAASPASPGCSRPSTPPSPRTPVGSCCCRSSPRWCSAGSATPTGRWSAGWCSGSSRSGRRCWCGRPTRRPSASSS
jgi:hypothetical protein